MLKTKKNINLNHNQNSNNNIPHIVEENPFSPGELESEQLVFFARRANGDEGLDCLCKDHSRNELLGRPHGTSLRIQLLPLCIQPGYL